MAVEFSSMRDGTRDGISTACVPKSRPCSTTALPLLLRSRPSSSIGLHRSGPSVITATPLLAPSLVRPRLCTAPYSVSAATVAATRALAEGTASKRQLELDFAPHRTPGGKKPRSSRPSRANPWWFTCLPVWPRPKGSMGNPRHEPACPRTHWAEFKLDEPQLGTVLVTMPHARPRAESATYVGGKGDAAWTVSSGM